MSKTMKTSYTVQEVALIMQCTSGNVTHMIRAKEIPATKVNRKYEISSSWVERWVYMARIVDVQDFINERLGEE